MTMKYRESGITKILIDDSNNQTIAGTKTFSTPIVGSITGNSATATNAAGSFNVPGSLTATGTITAGSSRKLKENITECKLQALDIIKQINIVNYNYIADEAKADKIGFIAEDTHQLLSTPNRNAIDITNTLGLLLKGMQEIIIRLNKLENNN